jgi:hypothetical protein
MGAFAFNLEHGDGSPADPPTLKTAVPNWASGDTSRWGVAGRCAWSGFGTFATTTAPTGRLPWSFRTWPKERLASSSDVS